MISKSYCITVVLALVCFCDNVKSFGVNHPRIPRRVAATLGGSASTTLLSSSSSETPLETTFEKEISIWEKLANGLYPGDFSDDFERTKAYANTVSLLRVGIPSLSFAASAKISYPFVAIALANAIDDSGVFAVVSQDASQYIQNILTTSGLTFSILLGQTYYFMYQVRTIRSRTEQNVTYPNVT